MYENESEARIKINEMLKSSGWRLLKDESGPQNIRLETHIKSDGSEVHDTKLSVGFSDYLLLDERNFPIAILEAKQGDPLTGKEQARGYANEIGARFIILSNGETSFFWDMENGNPIQISYFPTQEDLSERLNFKPNITSIFDEFLTEDYVASSQYPDYQLDPRWIDKTQRKQFITDNDLRFLREYQTDAIKSLQKATKEGKNRFLFEMATGTGKTLTAAAIIKLYLKTGNARRVLFLVDRLELEDQARKAFDGYLKKDYRTVIYKEDRNDWNKADILVTTIQSISGDEKYKKIFSPNDFDLIISDEAHRSISGVNRNVFEYFLGHKLGLTATPKDYLKNFTSDELNNLSPKELETRNLKSTYKIFGCESGDPTFSYTLLDGVKQGYLIAPTKIDCRTDITTQLLAEEGYKYTQETPEGEEELVFKQSDYEKKFFSDKTNSQFVDVFMNNALKDPFTGEIGKTIFFAVSQKHASKLVQVLNVEAMKRFPGKYNSDFAVQVTSNVTNAQQMTTQFTHDSNNLNGTTKFLDGYISSKTRVCVTVGMMTTGYDCQDLLNIGLARPIFSPSDFVQIKGRGTRKYTFTYTKRFDGEDISETKEKEKFKVFDFFGNFEYFEEKYDYEEKLKLPIDSKPTIGPDGGTFPTSKVDSKIEDLIRTYLEEDVDVGSSRIDNEMFGRKTKKDREAELKTVFESMVLDLNIESTLIDDSLKLFIRYIMSVDVRNKIEQKQFGALSSDYNFSQSINKLGTDNINKITTYIKQNGLI